MSDREFWMTAKRNGHCAECQTDINEGDRMVWVPNERKAYCGECGVEVAGDDPRP